MGAILSPESRVLVIAVARIGDTILATPLMRALKNASPRGMLTVLAHPKRMDVLGQLPFVDRLGSIDKSRAWWQGRIGARKHDVAIVLGRDASLLDYALRVSHATIAYDEPGFSVAARQNPRLTRLLAEEGTHAVLDRLRLIEVLGVTGADRRLAYHVTAAERSAARATLAARWPLDKGPLIGLQMSSFPTKAHRDWPVDSFLRLADALALGFPTVRFAILGDSYSRQMAAPFIARHASRTLLAAGQTSLRQAAALIAELDLYIGVDTGPTHVAGALGVPMVGLYHCLYPGRLLAPLDHPACRVMEHPLTGSPRCEASGMDSIAVDAVLQAVRELLLQPRQSRQAGA